MDKIVDIYNLILHSNTLNFAVFLTIVILIFKKVDVPTILESMCNKIKQAIENSEKDKKQAQENKSQAIKSAENTEKEIDNINSVANDKVRILKEQITQDANSKIASIKNNANRILDFEEKSLTSIMISNIGLKSVETAQNQILREISQNEGLHYKFIDDSIDELSKAVINDIY